MESEKWENIVHSFLCFGFIGANGGAPEMKLDIYLCQDGRKNISALGNPYLLGGVLIALNPALRTSEFLVGAA